MVLALTLIIIVIILFMWTYILSINLFLWDFKDLYSSALQSDIVNQRNFDLTPIYMNSYNSDLGNNNYDCTEWDNDCKFRWVFGFLPPNSMIDLWNFRLIQGSWFVLDFTWVINKWIKLWVYEMWWELALSNTYFWSWYISRELAWKDYNLKLKNQWDSWVQYMIYLSWWNWLKDFSVDENNFATLSYDYSYYTKRSNLFDKKISYNSWFYLSIDTLISFLWLDPNLSDDVNTLHFYWWWNDYLWVFIYSSYSVFTTWQNILIDGLTWATNCTDRLNWYYWNPMRWDIVWPIDSTTLATWQSSWFYSNLSMAWWLYSNCDGKVDDIYGEIIYTYTPTSTELFFLQSWRDYDYVTNTIIENTDLNPSMQFYNYWWKDIPIWLIYDSNYGIWFMGWRLSTGTQLEKIVEQTNLGTWMNILIYNLDANNINFIDYVSGSALR